jgi:hypothetical protein
MRHRRWVVVLAILIIAVLPLGFLGLRVASRHPAVKRTVLSRVMPEVEGELTIGELEVGLAYVNVRDLVIDLGGGSRVEVPSATVNLSLLKLLSGGLMPERSLSTIIVSDPRVTVAYGLEEAEGPSDDPRPPRAFEVSSLENYIPDYLGVSGASVSFIDLRTGSSITIDSIDLLLERGAAGPVSGGASGNCLGGSRNLQAHFTWDSGREALAVTGTLSGARLDDRLPVPPDVAAQILSGAMSASFTASVSPDSIGALDVSFDVEDGLVALTAFDEELTGVSARGRLRGGEVALERASGQWRGAEWSASGGISSDDGSLRDVRFDATGIPLGPVGELLEIAQYELRGRINVSAGASGTLDDPSINVTVSSGSAGAGGVDLGDVSASATISTTDVEVRDLTAALFGGVVTAAGTLDRDESSGEWRFDVLADARGLDIAQLAEASTGDTTARGRLSLQQLEGEGTLSEPRVESLVRWDGVQVGPTRLGSGAGGFMLADGALSASLGSADRTFAATVVIEEVFDAPDVRAEVALEGLAVDSLLPALSDVAHARLTGAVTARGPADSLFVDGEVALASETAGATVAVAGLVSGPSDTNGGSLRLDVESRDATLRDVPVPFTTGVSLTPEELALTDLMIANSFEGNVRVGLDEERVLRAGLVISEAGLPEVLKALTGASPQDADGLVFASVSVHGTVDDPVATAQLSVGAATVAGVQGLDASAVVEYRDDVIELSEFVMREGGRDVLTASGRATPGGTLEMSVSGDGIPGPMLAGSPGTRFDATIGIGGTTADPTVDGRLTSSDGDFLGVPFDDYSARLTFADGLARVDPLVLEREGGYRATVVGTVPLGLFRGEPEAHEGSLTVEVDGNPLALLCEFTDVAGCGPGSGTLSAVLVGDGESVTVASARLEARAQRVYPAGLFERVDDVTVSLDVLDGAVVSGEATGRIDNGTMVVRSERGVVVDERELTSLTVGGVDLGVLALRTDERGITANVPGLMLPDAFGRIALRGKEGSPSLYIAGPSDRPLLWGELEFSDLSFTYPFVDSDDGGGGIGDLMGDAEWSLRMTAGRNLWYWRPDANLNVERGGSLDFVGVPSQHTMCVSGSITSTRGTVTYLHTEFDVREFTVDFPSFCEQPRFSVDAETRVADGTAIGLSMQLTDGAPVLAASGVTLDESALVLTSDSPDDNTPEKIMSKLQYGVSYDLLEEEEQAELERRRAVELIGTQIGLRVARPLLAPIESRIRRNLNLDLVRIDVDFVEHFLMQMDLWTASEGTAQYVPFTANTRMILGKYISRDWMFSYLGVVEQYEEDIGETALGLRSELGIEYEVSRNTSLSLRVAYDPALAGWDRRVTIENRFEF